MLKIGEFAALTTISIHMLRNYDKIGLLVPQHVDDWNGYRYYDNEQLVQANQIVALKSMGFGLEEIKEALGQKPDSLVEILQAKMVERNLELEKIQNQMKQIQITLDTEKASKQNNYTVIRKKISSAWVISNSGDIKNYPEEGRLWEELNRKCMKNGIKIREGAPAMAINHGLDETTGLMNVEVQFTIDKQIKSVPQLTVMQLPEREVASVVFKGSYIQIGDINTMVAKWLEKNSLEIIEAPFNIYYSSPGNCIDDKDFITEICFPIKEK